MNVRAVSQYRFKDIYRRTGLFPVKFNAVVTGLLKPIDESGDDPPSYVNNIIPKRQ